MTILVTGATGFVGQALVARLRGRSCREPVRLLDRVEPPRIDDERFTALAGDLLDPAVVTAALAGVDTVIHLASVPGAAAEADPVLARRVNIDATLGLLEQIDAGRRPVRFVYASSIAVFGSLPGHVDDATLALPAMVYGAQKRMMELALADFHRRGRVRGIALRLPGVVARPSGASGLKSAFMSEIFHAAANGDSCVLPVSRAATAWMMSGNCAAGNLLYAATLGDVSGQALTLPAVRVRMGDLADLLFGERSPDVRFEPDAALEAAFGSYPPLSTPAAEALGFRHDGDLAALADTVLADVLDHG